MYNPKYLPQLEKFRVDVFGRRGDSRELEERAKLGGRRVEQIPYSLPAGIKVIPCVQDTNGEWIPDLSAA